MTVVQPTANVADTIAAVNERFMGLFAEHDAAGIAALFTEQGQILPADRPAITGREGIRQFWQGAMELGARKVELRSAEVEVVGEKAYELGRFRLLGDDDRELDNGRYTAIWKRDQGDWRLHRDVWNTSPPPA